MVCPFPLPSASISLLKRSLVVAGLLTGLALNSVVVWSQQANSGVFTQSSESQQQLEDGTNPSAESSFTVTTDDNNVKTIRTGLSQTETVTLDLPMALRLAEEQNPTLKASEDAVRIERARVNTRKAEFLPDINVEFSKNNYIGGIQTFGREVIRVNRPTYRPQAIFKFPIFQGGERSFSCVRLRKIWLLRNRPRKTRVKIHFD